MNSIEFDRNRTVGEKIESGLSRGVSLEGTCSKLIGNLFWSRISEKIELDVVWRERLAGVNRWKSTYHHVLFQSVWFEFAWCR